MVLRTAQPASMACVSPSEPWPAFLASQTGEKALLACISQPAHAALAGRLAMALNGRIFEPVPEEVLETIADHDAGWAETDLTALEQAESRPPTSFVSLPAESAVRIWRRSIECAAKRSRLSEYLVMSHFCLLAPQDGQREHQLFREEQEERLRVAGIGASY